RFTLADVARTTHDKLVRRHPHVFGATKAADADAVVQTWDAIKQAERAQKSAANSGAESNFFAGVSRAAPSLSLAQKLQKRAAEVGFDWPNAEGALAKIDEELTEVQRARDTGDPEVVRMELGDLLFSVVNVARKLGVDAETALRSATDKFITRFERVQLLAVQRGIELSKSEREATLLLGDRGMKLNLIEQVAEFFNQRFISGRIINIEGIQRIDHFVGFFDQIAHE
ncbi:MAG: MazG family protein, partial [Acidimicrobiia bacterium]|nr:MazG family protein [Acidimicrobiia bacterium]